MSGILSPRLTHFRGTPPTLNVVTGRRTKKTTKNETPPRQRAAYLQATVRSARALCDNYNIWFGLSTSAARHFSRLRKFLSSDLPKTINFIIEVDKLKAVLRKTKPVGLDRYENAAEHSWQACLLAQLLSKYASAPLDIVRVTELLLVHDIPEIDVGDQIVYQAKDNSRAEAERAAAARIFGLLPEHQADWLMSRWQEYEDRKTREAVFAHAIDRLTPVLHNIHNNGQSWRENRVPLDKIRAVNAVIGDACPLVWEYVQDILVELSKEGWFDYGIEHA